MKNLLKYAYLIFSIFILLSCEKDNVVDYNSLNNDNIENPSNPYNVNLLQSIDTHKVYERNYNWNDFAKNSQSITHFNSDNIPDIISWYRTSNSPSDAPIFKIYDYTGKTIYEFDIEQHNESLRDSLNNIIYDWDDLNSDGINDIVLTYMGEWQNPGMENQFNGINTYVLLSNSQSEYDVIELEDSPNSIQFKVHIFDFDGDGLKDILNGETHLNRFYKNLGNGKFEYKEINLDFRLEVSSKVDWDGDGQLEFINFDSRSELLTIVSPTKIEHIDFKNSGWVFYHTFDGNPTSWLAGRLTIIDADLDGDNDIVFGGFYSDYNGNHFEQKYFRNDSNKFSYVPNYIQIDNSLMGQLKVWVDDIDGDGDDDLYYPMYNYENNDIQDGKVFWWENTNESFKINKKFVLKY